MKSTWRRAGLALGLSLSLFAAGCGDDDNDNPTTPSSPAPQQPSPTPSPSASPSPSPAPSTAPQPPNEQPGDAVVFLGRVKSLDFPTLQIGGRTVTVSVNTQFARNGQGIDPSQIEIGQTVRVHGTVAADGTTVIADKISIEDNNNKQ
ncbi:MAG TPA: DUF5666 domain-containing protein [Vicinamibacteria bacterium]|jgi:hypothetical protein